MGILQRPRKRLGLYMLAVAVLAALIWFYPWKSQKISSLNVLANDVSADPEARCHAIFQLFDDFAKPGCTVAALRTVLTDTRWVQKTNVHAITAVGGFIPVELGPGPVFIASGPLVGTKQHPLYYDIYFRLSEDGPESVDGCLAMLKNKGDHDNVRLIEFALCDPGPERYCDVFTTDGKKSDRPTRWERAWYWVRSNIFPKRRQH